MSCAVVGCDRESRTEECRAQRGDESKAASLAVDRGLLRVEPGGRNAKCYYPPDFRRSEQGTRTTSLTSLIEGRSSGEVNSADFPIPLDAGCRADPANSRVSPGWLDEL